MHIKRYWLASLFNFSVLWEILILVSLSTWEILFHFTFNFGCVKVDSFAFSINFSIGLVQECYVLARLISFFFFLSFLLHYCLRILSACPCIIYCLLMQYGRHRLALVFPFHCINGDLPLLHHCLGLLMERFSLHQRILVCKKGEFYNPGSLASDGWPVTAINILNYLFYPRYLESV